LYTPTAFREERAVWRSVIQLNLIRSIRIIMDAVVSALHERAVRIDSGDESDSDMEDSLGPLDDVRSVAARLAPIRTIEAALISKLVPRDEEEPTRLTAEEVFVRPGASWKGQLSAARSWKGKAAAALNGSSRPGSPGNSTLVEGPSEEDITMGIHACRLDMIAIWNHSSTREILRRRKLRLEESPGLYVQPEWPLYVRLSRTAFFKLLGRH
jgi:guanine nucleotide-binding protein alpha-1 subunit